MEYRITRGQEHKLVLSSDIFRDDQFMFQAYNEARNALAEIVKYSNEANERTAGSNMMFESLQNIIAFSGKRGQGKTSTMLSFSNTLRTNQLKDDLNQYSYEVLPPIDPTILEEKQNILALILSRMYRRAEEVWTGEAPKELRPYHNYPTEAEKNLLLHCFQRCLADINAIKTKADKEIKSLTDISIISDSATLREDLHDLIQKYLRFVLGVDKSRGFLVIQLDDTDFQITKGYEILEDIRKYFSIPNVIILMATDLSMLRTVVLQHYVTLFAAGIKSAITDTDKLSKLESKYMDKIVPPVHAIHLPKLEEYILRYGNQMKFIYEDKNTNILFDYSKSGDNNLLSPQELILRYIYRKTGIVFVSNPASYHGFIPTTLRGLAQLLSLLSTLDDIPEISQAQMKDTKLLVKAEKERVKVAQCNIERFEKYFLHEWIWAKLSNTKAEKIEKLAEEAPSERLKRAITILNEEYDKAFVFLPGSEVKYNDFIYQLENLINGNREQKDSLYILAVQTWLTIANHKAILKQIKTAIDGYKEGVLVFDFSPAKTYLPYMYLSPQYLEDEKNVILFEQIPNRYDKKFDPITELLFRNYSYNGKSKTCFSYLHITAIIQALGSAELISRINKETPQELLYQSQMTIAILISNLEVQMEINSNLEKYEEESGTPTKSEKLSQGIYRKVELILNMINSEAEGAPIMANTEFYKILELKNDGDDKQGITDMDTILKDVDARFDAKPELVIELVQLYKNASKFAKRLKAAEKQDSIDAYEIESFNIELDQFLDQCQSLCREVTDIKSNIFNLQKIQLGTTTQESFRSRFNTRFEKLCTACNIAFTTIKVQAKGNSER